MQILGRATTPKTNLCSARLLVFARRRRRHRRLHRHNQHSRRYVNLLRPPPEALLSRAHLLQNSDLGARSSKLNCAGAVLLCVCFCCAAVALLQVRCCCAAAVLPPFSPAALCRRRRAQERGLRSGPAACL